MPSVNNMANDEMRFFWFCGYGIEHGKTYISTQVLNLLVNEYIWNCKLKKSRLSLPSLIMELDSVMTAALAASRKMLRCCRKNDMLIFRRWCEWQEGRGDGEEEEEEDGEA
jgi:hypothetical protein